MEWSASINKGIDADSSNTGMQRSCSVGEKAKRQNDRKKAQAIQRVTPQSGAAGAREEDPHVTSQDRKAVARHLAPAPSLFNKLTAPHIATLCQP